MKVDKRKYNGGHSTVSKKAVDRRKRLSFSNPEAFNELIEIVSGHMAHFYESVRKDFMDEHIRHGAFYVYTHSLDGDVVYVGKGKNERAINWANRTDIQHSNLMRNGQLQVEIVANYLNEENALLIEDALIQRLKPAFNRTIYGQTEI